MTCDQWLGIMSCRTCDWATRRRNERGSVPPTITQTALPSSGGIFRLSHCRLSSPFWRGESAKAWLGCLAFELMMAIIFPPPLGTVQVDGTDLDGSAEVHVRADGPVSDAQLHAASVLPEPQQHDLVAALGL